MLLYFSDGVMKLSGHTREEYGRLAGRDAMNLVCEHDRDRVSAAVRRRWPAGRCWTYPTACATRTAT
ncbi:hypothetical protein [Enterocloster lavalensis]|uniref:hypothetical protein n=1 Tax=Enterocloster lavalensis TaxID=460384 RepID=UPI0034A11825